MALKSDTPSPPNGVVDIIPLKSAQEPEEDLEDGEIFDDEDDEMPVVKPDPPAPPKESIATIVQQMQMQQQQMAAGGGGGIKRRGSPMDRGRSRMTRSKRPSSKRIRDDERNFVPKKRRRSDDEKLKEMDEEDEIMGRDASPNLREWDRFRSVSDEEDDELGFNEGPGGGRGMGMRRGRREFRSRRGGRGGRGGGRRGPISRRDGGLCKFFLQGNCQRGGDCPYSHQIHPKKYEMCKFYMNDCCVKKDKCNFMHEEFPCKFYHLGLKCFAGKRCKFSHDKVTPFIKQMLIKQNSAESDKHFLNHLQTTADSRSPTPPDYSDYEGPQGNSNYVTVTRKRGSNRDDITVDDIELADSDHDADPEGEQSHSHSRSHRHSTSSRSQRSGRHSRDEDRSSREYDHRDNHKEPRDHRDRETRDRDHRGDREHRVSSQRDRERDRDWEKEKEREWDKEREYNPAYEERRSDEDEGRTPMPSPSQNSSDSYGMNRLLPRRDADLESRDERPHTPPAPPQKSSHQRQHGGTPSPPRENRHATPPPAPVSEEPLPTDQATDAPPNLPKKQMELYLRIQQQQREAGNIEDEDMKDKEEEFKEDDWYSSDEEGGGGGPLATILKKLKAQPSQPTLPKQAPKVALPNVSALPDIDISAVTRLLSSVRETIEQQKNSQPPKPSPSFAENEPEQEKKTESSKFEEKKRRDPRLLSRGGDSSPPPSSSASTSSSTSQPPMKLPPLDIDLRMSSRDSSSTSTQMSRDVDLRQLPFKPVPMHQAAREIDASTTSNPPIPWAPTKFPPPPKPDYSHVQPKNMMDPRLRRFQTGGGIMPPTPQLSPMHMAAGGFMLPQFTLPPQQGSPNMAPAGPPVVRDPRQRAFANNDPRRKQQGPPQMPPQMPPEQGPPYQQQGPFNQGRLQGPPGMPPMYPRGDSDLRNPGLAFNQSDIDLRFQQPASHHQFP